MDRWFLSNRASRYELPLVETVVCPLCVAPGGAVVPLLGFRRRLRSRLVVETLLEILPAVVCRGLRADTGAPRSESDVSP